VNPPAWRGQARLVSFRQPQQIRPRAFLRNLDVTLYGIVADHIRVRVSGLAARHCRQLCMRSVKYGVIRKQNIGARLGDDVVIFHGGIDIGLKVRRGPLEIERGTAPVATRCGRPPSVTGMSSDIVPGVWPGVIPLPYAAPGIARLLRLSPTSRVRASSASVLPSRCGPGRMPWPNAGPPKFRRDPFARDVLSDPGRVGTASHSGLVHVAFDLSNGLCPCDEYHLSR
jgi:hypothetical protein